MNRFKKEIIASLDASSNNRVAPIEICSTEELNGLMTIFFLRERAPIFHFKLLAVLKFQNCSLQYKLKYKLQNKPV